MIPAPGVIVTNEQPNRSLYKVRQQGMQGTVQCVHGAMHAQGSKNI